MAGEKKISVTNYIEIHLVYVHIYTCVYRRHIQTMDTSGIQEKCLEIELLIKGSVFFK